MVEKFEQYRLPALPVVNVSGRLVGVIHQAGERGPVDVDGLCPQDGSEPEVVSLREQGDLGGDVDVGAVAAAGRSAAAPLR